MRTKSEWARVSKGKPCPVCERPDFCTVTTDGAVARCTRVESEKPAPSRSGEMAWIHKLSGAEMNYAESLPKRERPKPVIDWRERALSMYGHEQAGALRIAIAEQLGVRIASLEALGVGCGWDYQGKAFSAWPQRDGEGKVVGISRRYADGEKKTMQHSSPGLHYASNVLEGTSPILVVEGGSDTAALLSIGLSGVGRPSNTGGVDYLSVLLRKTPRAICVVGERDTKPERVGDIKHGCATDCNGCSWCSPGIFGARVTCERLRSLLKRRNIIWRLPPTGFKDIRQWINADSSLTRGRLLNKLEAHR